MANIITAQIAFRVIAIAVCFVRGFLSHIFNHLNLPFSSRAGRFYPDASWLDAVVNNSGCLPSGDSPVVVEVLLEGVTVSTKSGG